MNGFQLRPSKLIEGVGVVAFLVVSSLTIFMIAPNPTLSVNGVYWQDWEQTPFGPLGPADRDLLVKVRQAGLWEIPVGQQAQDLGQSPIVREVGAFIEEDHIQLDERTRDVAAQLDVVLPSEASPQQQRWMTELSNLEGDEYDRAFAQLLREAHGGVFESLAEVRAGTRNELMRSFASHGVVVVLRHMSHLERTGLVEYEGLPEPLPPDRRPGRAEPRTE